MGFDMDLGLTPSTPQNINIMSSYENLKKSNIKFPMSKEMLKYYTDLGFKCFVIKYHNRMDGSVYCDPELFYSKDGILDCISYSLFDRSDIRRFISGYNYNYFNLKYEQKCKELSHKYENT